MRVQGEGESGIRFQVSGNIVVVLHAIQRLPDSGPLSECQKNVVGTVGGLLDPLVGSGLSVPSTKAGIFCGMSNVGKALIWLRVGEQYSEDLCEKPVVRRTPPDITNLISGAIGNLDILPVRSMLTIDVPLLDQVDQAVYYLQQNHKDESLALHHCSVTNMSSLCNYSAYY